MGFCRRAPSRKSSVDNRKSSSSMSASSTPSRWRKLLDADCPLGMTAPRPMARSYLLIDTIPRYWIKKGKEIQYKNVEKGEKALQTQRVWPSDARIPLPRQVTVFAQRRECPGKTDPYKRAEKVHPHTLRNKPHKSRKGGGNDEKSRNYTQNET